jgi:hypothetical protein
MEKEYGINKGSASKILKTIWTIIIWIIESIIMEKLRK